MLKQWQVRKIYENGGRVEAILEAVYRCPLGHEITIRRQIEYWSDGDSSRGNVLCVLAEYQTCGQCGIVMGLTELDRKNIKERLGDKLPHEA